MKKIVWLCTLLATSALAQQQFSLKQELQKLDAQATWKAVGPVQANAKLGLDRLQQYAITVPTGEGQSSTVTLLMGSGKGQNHVRYASVIVKGEANRASEKAHSFVGQAIINYCFGLNRDEQGAVRDAMRSAMGKFKGQTVLEKFSAGRARGEVSLKYNNPTVEIALTLERPDQPGQNGWKAFCGLES